MTFSNINYVIRGNRRHVRHLWAVWSQLTMAEGGANILAAVIL